MDPLLIVGIVVVALIVLALILKALWRVAEPNEALIISGFRARNSPGDTADSLGFKIVTGREPWYCPVSRPPAGSPSTPAGRTSRSPA